MNKEQAIAAHVMRVEMGESTSYRLTCNLGDDAECHQVCETHPEGGCGMELETCVKKVYSGGCVVAEWVNDGGIESVTFEHTVEFPVYYEWMNEFPTILAADEVETVECEHASWDGRFCEFCGARLSQAAVPTHEGGENE